MRSRAVVSVALGVLLIALVAACGSKKSSTSTTTSTTTTTTAAAATTTNGSAKGSGSGTTPSFASAKNCKDLEGLAAKVSQSFAQNSNGQLDLNKEADALDALAAAAPSEIKGDFKTFADAFKKFAKAYGDAKIKPGETPTAAQIAKLAELSKSFDTAALQKAEQHLAAWGKSHCGLSSTG